MRVVGRVVGGLLVAAVAAGCRARQPEPLRLAPVPEVDRLYADDGEAITDSTRQVIADSAAWALAWARATRAQRSEPTRPGVNFESHAVVVVTAGRMRPGDQIRVDSVARRGRDVAVLVRTITGCAALPGATYPLQIVRIPRAKRRVEFIERRERGEGC
jgi:hypothetical protein